MRVGLNQVSAKILKFPSVLDDRNAVKEMVNASYATGEITKQTRDFIINYLDSLGSK